MGNARPNLEGLFNGSSTPERDLSWLNGKVVAPESEANPAAEPAAGPAPASAPRPAAPSMAATSEGMSLLDPVSLAERYFAVLQALLDLQREAGLRLAHQLAVWSPLDRLRR